MKKSLIIALWCALAVGGGVLYPFWGVRASGVVYEQNFDTLNVGALNGQDNWAGDTQWSVTAGTDPQNYNSTNFVLIGACCYTIDRIFTETENLLLDVKIALPDMNSANADAAIELISTDNNSAGMIKLNATSAAGGDVEIFSNAGANDIGNFSEGIYYDLQIETDTANDRYRANFNDSGWSAWYAYNNIASNGIIDTIRLRFNFGNGNTFGLDNLSISGDIVVPPPVITSPADGATIDAAVTPVSGTCEVIAGYESVFVQSATSTSGIIAESFANCDNGVWNTNTSTPLLIYQGGQEVRAFLAENDNLNNRSTSSNIITLWGGASAGTYWTADTPLPEISASGATSAGLTDKLIAPLLFFSNLKTKIDAISTATTSAFYLAGATTTAMMTNFFTPMKTGFAVVLWLLVAAYFIKRIAGLVI